MAANWRAQPPVVMDIGPVLHPDDVVAGKMSALFTRAEPRDFLDVDAAVTSGRYSRERLCELAEEADAGFDRRILADLFAVLDRYPNRRFATYGASDGAHGRVARPLCGMAPATPSKPRPGEAPS